MFQLSNERNIHAPAKTKPTDPPPDFNPKYRKVTRSPIEEMTVRVTKHGTMEPIPDALAALMFQDKGEATVAGDGISFILNGTERRYYHENCATCHSSRAGEKVLFAYNRDDLSVIYVLTDDERYMETVPLAEGVDWFSDEAKEQIKANHEAASRVHAGLKKTHGRTTKREHDRTKANREALQTTHSIPPPKDFVETEPERAPSLPQRTESGARPGFSLRQAGTARPGFERAEEVKAAQDAVLGQRAAHEERQDRTRERIRRERGNVDDLLGRTQEAGVQAETETEDDEAGAELDALL